MDHPPLQRLLDKWRYLFGAECLQQKPPTILFFHVLIARKCSSREGPLHSCWEEPFLDYCLAFIESFEHSTLCPVSQVLMNTMMSAPKLIFLLHFQPQIKGFSVFGNDSTNRWGMGVGNSTTKLIILRLQALSLHLLNWHLINSTKLHFLADDFVFREIIKLKKRSAKLTAPQSLSLACPWWLSFLTPSLWDLPLYKVPQEGQWVLPAASVTFGALSFLVLSPWLFSLSSHSTFVFSTFLFARYWQILASPSVFTLQFCFK